VAQLAAAGVLVVVYEASLLVETGEHHALAGLIVVAAPEAVQLRRCRSATACRLRRHAAASPPRRPSTTRWR